MNTKHTPAQDKGLYRGSCNITSCQKTNSAEWFNHSTLKYYCESCAQRLNNDEFNKRDAQRLFGHELCTYTPPPSPRAINQ